MYRPLHCRCITEAQNILAEITGVLESHLYLDAVCLSLEVDRLMKCLRTVVQITDVSDDPLRLMVFQLLRLRTAQILEIDRQGRIQVCCLMETALDLCCRETGLLKDLRVRKEIDAGSGRLRASKFREKPLLQFDGRDSSFIVVMMYISIPADLDIQISRKRIDNRGTDTVETAAGLVCGIVELAACMQGRKDKSSADIPFSCISTGIPRPLSVTVAEPSFSSVTWISLQYPARCSSTALSTIS